MPESILIIFNGVSVGLMFVGLIGALGRSFKARLLIFGLGLLGFYLTLGGFPFLTFLK